MNKKIRGVWLTNVASNVLDSQENINQAVQVLAETGFNTVFPVVWNKGYTLFKSEVMAKNFGNKYTIDPKYQANNRDLLKEIIEAAKKVNIQVIPWFEYGFAYSHISIVNVNKQLLESKLKNKKWIAYDSEEKVLVKNGFQWLNALDNQVQNFMLSLILEVVKNYEVDGIQGDDRLPAFPKEGILQKNWATKFINKIEPKFSLQNKANILTNYLQKIYDEVKNIDQNLIVSMSPHPAKFGFREYLQDWKTWLDKNIVDTIHPQLYARSFSKYKLLCQENFTVLNKGDHLKFAPGVLLKIGDYRLNQEDLWSIIKYHRDLGIEGEVFFFWEGLKDNDYELAKFLQKQKYIST